MRTLVILNPQAGNAHHQQEVALAVERWRASGWPVDLVRTEYAGHATELSRQGAAAGYELITAAGGDGTVNEVINGVAHTAAAFAALPVGTGNVWVRELRLPISPLRAADLLRQGTIHQIDLGMAGERYFLLMAGVGFDAAVTREVLPEQKRRLGMLAYAIQAIALATTYAGARARVSLDGTPVKGEVLMVLISNSRLYGGFLRIAHRAALTDGLLDVCLLKGHTALGVIPILAAVLLRRQLPAVFDYHQAREVEVACSRSMHVQVDGDAIGHTPMVFRVAPRAIRALIPPSVAAWDLLGPPLPLHQRLRRRLTRRGKVADQAASGPT